MTIDEACAQLTVLSGRIKDICMGAGLRDTEGFLVDIEDCIDLLKIKLRQKQEQTNEPHS